MANVRTFSRSFAGGEVTPEFWGRIDDVKYQTGLATCRNMLVLPHGPVANRPGFEFVRQCGVPDNPVRVIPFSFSTTQTMVIELGENYARFHTNGATLLSGDPDPYEPMQTITGVDAPTDTLTINAHGFADGKEIQFDTSNTLPAGLVAGAAYYVIDATANTFKVARSVGGSAVNITSAGSGTHRAGRRYTKGDLVEDGGGIYYSIADNPGEAPPDIDLWYEMPGEIYQIPMPYESADLFDIHYVQSSDVLTLVHPSHPVRELRRLGATKWVLEEVVFQPQIEAPGVPTVTATRASSPTQLRDYRYRITAMGPDNIEESLGGGIGTTNQTNNLLQTDAFNTITWDNVEGAGRYRIYREDNGLFGYVGETEDLTFKDEGVTPDLSITPPNIKPTFDAAGKYPAAVSYYQQRRVFAGTNEQPQSVWMTRSGTESNLTYSLPSRDDDSIGFRVAAREANTIRHIVPLQDLVLLTSSGEWRLQGSEGPVAPSNIKVGPQSYVGANNVQPVIVNNSLLYAAARGGHVREMGFSNDSGGYITGDLSLRAPHLFDTFRIEDMAYSKAPVPFCWFVSSTGKLLGFTYIPEQQIGAWHQHDTVDGEFESIAVVAEGEEDVLYAVIRRVINGNPTRYIERLRSRQFVAQADAFFVDSGLTYDGAPVSTLAGLDHLEGEEVSILIDGAVHPRRTVVGGSINLDVPGSKIHVGLPITADMQTLPLAFETQGFGQGRVKNVNKVWLRVYRSSGIFAGPSPDRLTEAKQRTTENWGQPPALKTEEIEIMVEADWTDNGSVFVRQQDPLPLTIVSMSLEVAIGG